MNGPTVPPSRLDESTQAIRDVYARSSGKRGLGEAMLQSRLRHYDDLFAASGCLPMGDRRILDLGCGNGKWLHLWCCGRWGAEQARCVGVDLVDKQFAQWRAENPDSKVTLLCRPAHELDFPDHAFDIIHHSMMFSSVPDADLRAAIAGNMWRMLRPGGIIVSYDFWINPVNRNTVGITRAELRRLFPRSLPVFGRTITLAPPICRALGRLGGIVVALERMKVMNTHYLTALLKPAGGREDASP